MRFIGPDTRFVGGTNPQPAPGQLSIGASRIPTRSRKAPTGGRAGLSSAYQRIYAIVRRIPGGRVSTYGWIAAAARCAGPRQVGYALHAIDDATPIPWHRVVNARGAISLKNASGITQRLRLHAEGVRFGAGGKIDLSEFGWMPRRRRRAA